MRVNASMVCEVDISQKEAFKALVESFGITDIIYPEVNCDKLWEFDAKSRSFVEYADTSYHGSQDWTPTGNAVSDKEAVAIVQQLKGMREYIDRRGQEGPGTLGHDREQPVTLHSESESARRASHALSSGTSHPDHGFDAR